jgi:hypothetical protein
LNFFSRRKKMKKFAALFLCVFLIAPLVYAETLTTANPAGKGNWIFEGVALRDMNVSNISDGTATTYGVLGCYGITDMLDFTAVIGSSTYAGTGIAGMTATAYSGVFRYSLLQESASLPVSLSASLGYTSITSSMAGTVTNGSKTGIQFNASKMMIPFIPYAALAYNSLSLGGDSTSIELTVGSAFAWSRQNAVLLEYTLLSTTASGTTYSGSQIAFGIAYLP